MTNGKAMFEVKFCLFTTIYICNKLNMRVFVAGEFLTFIEITKKILTSSWSCLSCFPWTVLFSNEVLHLFWRTQNYPGVDVFIYNIHLLYFCWSETVLDACFIDGDSLKLMLKIKMKIEINFSRPNKMKISFCLHLI